MDIQELRIGNLIMAEPLRKYNTYTVYGIKEDKVYYEGDTTVGLCDIGEIKPIPLTEEWLLKFGFKKGRHLFIIKDGEYDNGVGFHDTEKKWFYYNDSLDASCHIITSIKYVHQLQNLYYSLTNTELCLTN